MEPEELFAAEPTALAVLARVRELPGATSDGGADPPFEVRTTRSQVGFRRRTGFAWLWRPGRYLRRPAAPVVLTIALGRHDPSPRFKEVVHPSPRHWIHHLEIHDPAEVDDQVRAWLLEAAERAGRR